jgi:hypothetical protein
MLAESRIVRAVAHTTFAFLAIVVAMLYPPMPLPAQNLQGPTTAIVVAFVTDTAGRPLSGADVSVVGTSVRGSTDDAGRVALLAVPAGKAVLRLRRLGFAELTVPISVTAGMTPESRYRLMPVATDIEKVVVRASNLKPDRYAKTGKFDGFYRRRGQQSGTFITREMIDSRNAQKTEDLLRLTTGVRIRYRGTTPFVQFARCPQVNVYIDGIRSHDGFRDFFALSPLQIEAMEIYHGMAQVPPEFSPRPNDCAAIVVWTRWHGA